jgi:hypothetical protein
MLTGLQIVTLVLVALTMTTAMAHALELPGKRRLSRDLYFAVQPIYYPGCTIVGGFAEVIGLLALLALLFTTPAGSPAFWLSLGAFVAFAIMDAVFWLITQPVNRCWLRDQLLSAAGSAFLDVRSVSEELRSADWTRLRDRWEYSHVARAVLSLTALVLIACAIAVT